MQIYIDTYGAFLGVQNGMFWIKPRHHEGRTFAIREVNSLLVTKGVTVSTDAMLLALENNIPLVLIDDTAHPQGLIWNGQYGSIATIRRKQALLQGSENGWRWIAKVLNAKTQHQKSLLEYLRSDNLDNHAFEKACAKAMPVLSFVSKQFDTWRLGDMDLAKVGGTFRGWEGTASRLYWRAIAAALPEKYRFDGRSFRPAQDNFNALLNYLYGMLYTMVELSLLKAGVDPAMGVLHVDRYNRPTMVFDVIEKYRHWADSVAIDICRQDLLPPDSFKEDASLGVRLASAAKNVVIPTFLAFVNEPILYDKKTRKRSTTLDLEAQKLVAMLLHHQ